MGVALYPVLETGPYDWGKDIDAKRLARAAEKLSEVARRSAVPDFWDFYSPTLEQAVADWGAEYVELGKFQERWFEGHEGLKTVRVLLRYCREHPDRLRDPGVAEDLVLLEELLTRAAAQGVRWHLVLSC